MKVLLSWLREFAPGLTADPEELGHAMSGLGMAVESLDPIGQGLDGIVVAEVLTLRSHPNADKIQLVEVDAGDGEPLQICCGAFNMAVGDKVPLATLGTVMPEGWKIARKKLRGEWSNGMLCSAAELALGEDHDGILVLDPSLEAGTPATEALGIVADWLYDLEINPNRPDAMSVAGVARDLAARYGVPFTLPAPQVPETGPSASASVTVQVEDPERCGRFTAKVLHDVQVRPSPPVIAQRLTALGMRPINNVVDASNYVMLELGQPSHPYDLARLPGRGFRVRRATAGEAIVTLDDVTRQLTTEDLLICDAEDHPAGIAGIMGGAAGEIDGSTTEVAVEMAWFAAMPVAKSSRRLGVRSEASARFERGSDPAVIELAHARFVELLGDAVGSVSTGTVDVVGSLPERAPVRLRTARVNSVLGTDLAVEEIRRLLGPIGFESTPAGPGDRDSDVTIPSYRPDSATEIDVIEEVARLHGYERITPVPLTAARFGSLTGRQADRRTVRQVMVGLGYAEAMPMPFLAPGAIERTGLPWPGITITNPLIADESVLRTALLPGLLETLAYNESHRNAGVGLFEIGHVFRLPPEARPLPDEREHLGMVAAGADAGAAVEAWEAVAAALATPGVALRNEPQPGLHPSRSAVVMAAGEVIGYLGEVDPEVLESHGIAERVAVLEVDLGRLLDLPHGHRPYRLVSRYPSSDLDLAFAVPDEVPASAVTATLRGAGGDLLAGLDLFDVYRGVGVPEGHRSLNYRLRFQAADRTLTEGDLHDAQQRTVAAVVGTHAAVHRG